MTVRTSPSKTFLAALLVAALGAAGARADEPSPAAVESARAVIVASGMTRSFDVVVPQMFGELERNVTATRPEIKESLHATLLALAPEFAKTEQGVVESAARALAKHMNEQELKDTAAFFASPSGKKYVEAQPLAFSEIMGAVQDWRQRLSIDILTRTREEMKKKGIDF
ncbi:MAG: DUF2059 domain-containing protein [Roseiarcus sp.]